jgi:hypothetical protein
VIVVSDTSPILNLATVGHLELLRGLFGEIVVPPWVAARSRDLGKQYGVEYAEVFHYIPPGASGADRDSRIDEYVKEHVVPLKEK